MKGTSKKRSGHKLSSQQKVTIFEVAEQAGVSIKTVSRVINDEPNVSSKTRDKVLKAVRKLNYTPNIAARGLSGKRSYVIGLVYENPDEFSYMKSVFNGVLEACDSEGYTLLLRPLTLPNPAVVDSIREFAAQARIDGIVLPPPLCDFPEVLALLKELNIPFAAITPKNPQPGAISILCEDEEASCRLTDYVLGQGHSRVGFIKGHPDHAASDKRLAGYRAALKKHGIAYAKSLVRQGYFDFESGRRAAAKLLGLAEPPSAIIASNDDMAAGAMFEARERGLDVPGDLAVVGFDDTPLASHMWPPLTTVRQPIPEMARTATRLLIQQLRGETTVEAVEPFNCEIVIRQSG